MSAKVQGTAHVFGTGATITNASVTAISAGHEFNLNDTVPDENGVTVETRRDDRVKKVNVRLRFQSSYTPADIGEVLTLANMNDPDFNDTYEIVRKGNESQARGYSECSYDLEKYEQINPT
ncbi:hypothetical protein [Rubellicoccus peritrichatus]|uniref:Uncharacterized protein n=1 Tax=Rubellicoccus peritrichatus TaxID=3080537 RepID=A0AAQ3L709_9BACT|nr:hypothetical protein [Puniceicoccus sp. CR14]WOO40377.1 hypothetical protein RZN69_17295 [Puniceicoccus sp. CR14]WOO40426.1 hypothetical protein RZN69_17540 [Puniceicoccus sp. CR14]WOO40475.1 hypothetical protein RZN69_17785 [Puniceicoccus sp. CR14]WOO40524.1 hypothetical protein RZN69_18030 [Puniceicoccus sp. CR14]